MKNGFLKLYVICQMALFNLFAMIGESNAAGEKLSKAAENLTADMKAFSTTVLWGAMVVGIGLIIIGAVKLTKREGEGGLGKALIFVIAGIVAVGIPALIQMAGQSMFESGNIGGDSVGGVTSVKR